MKGIFPRMLLSVVVLAPGLMMSSARGFASDCPPPASAIVPTLSAEVIHDKKAGVYKYRYTIKNGTDSKWSIRAFGVVTKQDPSTFTSAPHWRGRYADLPYAPSAFSWYTTDVDPAIANVVTGDATIPPKFYAVKAGASLGGFEIVSERPPGLLEFFARGDDYLKPTLPEGADVPDCPGHDPNGIDEVVGVTVGPAEPDLISVKIRTRDKSGLHHSSPVDPKNSKGQMSVLVISTPSFDASQVNISSVAFGPAQVAPVSSELIPTNRGEKLEGDEPSAWEKAIESTESKDEKKRHSQNLLLTFDVASLDVQCGIDLALFLRGETKTGQKFIGAAPAKVVGCKAGEPGVHKPPKKKQGKK